MRSVYKYPFTVTDEVSIDMPVGAQIISVKVHNGQPYIWAIVNPDTPVETKKFYVRGTGHELGDVGSFLGTFQLSSGALVFHLFQSL